MKQLLGQLRFTHLIAANYINYELERLSPIIMYRRPADVSYICFCTLSDALYGSADEIYGQIGIITGLKMCCKYSSDIIYDTIGWTTHEQRRVSYSSFGSEMLSATNSNDRVYSVKM